MATLIRAADNTIANIQPANGRAFTLPELYTILGCELVQVVRVHADAHRSRLLVFDEEGKLREPMRELNELATALAVRGRGIYPWDWIAGDALLCTSVEFP